MKILFAGLQYEYGKKELGPSFEYRQFFESLQGMKELEVSFFSTDGGLSMDTRDVVNARLVKIVEDEKPDLLFCFLYTNELKPETISYITTRTKTKTFNWFADDHWRFPVYSRFWAPLFTRVSTTDSLAIAKYKKIGVDVIKTQWAARKIDAPHYGHEVHDEISFVGKKYGKRGGYIEALKQSGLPAVGYGKGWYSGILTEEKMEEIFALSKININFTESFFDWKKQIAKLFLRKEFGKYFLNIHHPILNIQSCIGAMRRQIKARIFEIPAHGGFLVTGEADNLYEYYEDGKEIIVFKNVNDLIQKCQYYMSHEDERRAIARAGFIRTQKEHTYEHRFIDIFQKMNM